MIGVFDSGFGGLTVLKEIIKELPEYDYIYLGDNKRAPYGEKTEEEIIKFTDKAVQFLFDRGVKLIILACNTASAVALRSVQQKYLNGSNETDRKILGILIPTAEEIATYKAGSKIGLVGTRATIDSHGFEKEVKKLRSDIVIYSKACPLLVSIIEESWHKNKITKIILKKYLSKLKSYNLDALVLACTHYPIIEKEFKKIMGKKVKVLNPARIEALKLREYLGKHPEINGKISKKSSIKFLTTGDDKKMIDFAESILNMKIAKVERVVI